ncbi:extensin-like domain-containing protein [Sandaracinobacteroides saxicola]|uniref:Extensin family protein n=1 Tax=Sandaracinobacteroides saxicola TaxID=2759707 RepID=A0A7G5IJY4_9SPHN|nr:extensin family protein [Sandaracinobacteroides saxicola]QMW23676.1 extensin family protein [Sandaracinobacteroides saxicola]
MALIRRSVTAVILMAALASLLFACATNWPVAFRAPPLDLNAQLNPATGRQVRALRDDAPRCVALLDAAGARATLLPPLAVGECGYADAVRTRATNDIVWRPADRAVACPVAAALLLWEREVVQPAARLHLRERVTRIDHLGTYNCRRIGGRPDGDFSEHARANAIDVAGFRLADGRTVSVLRDWQGADAEARFLRAVRDGACQLFATTLSPDYNAAHADHLHLDMAARGGWWGGVCQ